MAEYSDRDAEYAAYIVERLLAREMEGLQLELELEPDVAVSDVKADAREFSQELVILERFDVPVPAVLIAEEEVPVSLSFAVRGSYESALVRSLRYLVGVRPSRSYVYRFLRRYERGSTGLTLLSRDQARVTFFRRATDFLATRIAAVRSWRNQGGKPPWYHSLSFPQLLRGQRVPRPGCRFTVSSNSNGLRVFWSGAYFLTPNYFSYPTSPAAGVLQSGTYIFGVDGGPYGNAIQWDRDSVVSLPGRPDVHLNY
jgi:hypothetical protein